LALGRRLTRRRLPNRAQPVCRHHDDERPWPGGGTASGSRTQRPPPRNIRSIGRAAGSPRRRRRPVTPAHESEEHERPPVVSREKPESASRVFEPIPSTNQSFGAPRKSSIRQPVSLRSRLGGPWIQARACPRKTSSKRGFTFTLRQRLLHRRVRPDRALVESAVRHRLVTNEEVQPSHRIAWMNSFWFQVVVDSPRREREHHQPQTKRIQTRPLKPANTRAHRSREAPIQRKKTTGRSNASDRVSAANAQRIPKRSATAATRSRPLPQTRVSRTRAVR